MSLPVSTVILGTGAYAPARVLTNTELALTIDTSDEWISPAAVSVSAILPLPGR
jgi:3-oxoacyl-[acyl-carrier-protein] synthase III